MTREKLREAVLAVRKTFPLRWRMVRQCRLPQRILGEPYFAGFEPGGGIYGEYWDRFDSNGVLFKGSYNHVSIAQFALHQYERAREDERARIAFFRHAGYLRDALEVDGTLRFPFSLPDYDLQPGFISAMAQGEAVSVFLRAYALGNDERYMDAARSALVPLERSTDSGGATLMRGNDVFFEEVPDLPTHILNGHLWAAFGVWEACRVRNRFACAAGTSQSFYRHPDTLVAIVRRSRVVVLRSRRSGGNKTSLRTYHLSSNAHQSTARIRCDD